jgi:DNA-directed RNA polymerase delta subunit
MKLKYCLSNHQVSTPYAGEKIILNFNKGNYYSLDQVGAFIWELLTQKSLSLDEMLQEVQENFDVENTNYQEDILSLIQDLKNEGLIMELALDS